MKTFFLFLATLGLSLAAPKPSLVQSKPQLVVPQVSNLIIDLMDFVVLIPIDDLKPIVEKHFQSDGTFLEVIMYLQGDEWAAIADKIANEPAVQQFADDLRDADFPIDFVIKIFRQLIEEAVPTTKPAGNGSLRPFLDDIESVLPIDDFVELLNEKLEKSSDFQDFYTKISSEKDRNLIEEICQIEEVQLIAQRLKDMDVHLDEALAVVYQWLGWIKPAAKISPRKLVDDLGEFWELLTTDKIKDIVNEHLETDAAFAAIIRYLQGDEFHELLYEIENIPGIQNFVAYLTELDVPVDFIVEFVHELIEDAVPGVEPDENGSLRPLLDDIEAALLFDEWNKLLNDKLQNSPDIQDLYRTISSDDARAVVEEIRGIEEVKRLGQRLRDMEAKVDEALISLYQWLGWIVPDLKKSPKKLIDASIELETDLKAFIRRKMSSEKARSLIQEARKITERERLIQRLKALGIKVDESLDVFYKWLGWGKPAAKISPRKLLDDFEDFLELIPIDKIKTIIAEHLESDGAFDAVVIYLQGKEWHSLVDEVGSKPAVKDFIKYLTDAGLPVELIIKVIHEIIENAVPGTEPDETGSLRPFLDDVESILPIDDLIKLLDDKMQNSADFQDLYTKISGEKAFQLVEEILKLEEVQRLVQRLRDMDVKFYEALAVIYRWLGWASPDYKMAPRNLPDDFQEFLALIPVDKIKSIVNQHFIRDGSFIGFVSYLQGDEWASLAGKIKSDPAVQDFVKILTSAGLPVEDIIHYIRDLVQKAVSMSEPVDKGSLRSFLDDIEAALPTEDLLNLLNEKMQKSRNFQAFYATISSEKVLSLVEEIRKIKEVQLIAEHLRNLDVKVDKALAVVYNWLGWVTPAAKKSPRNLLDDLEEFWELIPVDKIKPIVESHLKTDGAFGTVIAFLQGYEWHAIVKEVGSKPAVQEFIAYLTDAGIPVDSILTSIHELIENAVPEGPPVNLGYLRPFLDEVEAVLPTDNLIKLLDDKMQNSPDFQDFYSKISSEKARQLIEEVREIKQVKFFMQLLEDMGVEVNKTFDIIYDWLGWVKAARKVSSRKLVEDLLEFIALIPFDDLKVIVDKHLKTDGAFDTVVVYLQGNEWQALVDEIGSKPEVEKFVEYLTDAGVPVDIIIKGLNELIENADPEAGSDEIGNLRPFLDEVEDILPVDKLSELLDDKLQNSPDFQDLYTRISSEEARNLVEEVRKIKEVERLTGILRTMDVKIDEALNIVYKFLGWGKPALKKQPRSLVDDVFEFLALIPIDDIVSIFDEHLESDGALATVITYLQGDAWHDLLDEIGRKPAAGEFISYMTDAGLPLDLIIEFIQQLIESAEPGVEADSEGTLRPLLDEIELTIPFDDLVELLDDKLETSPDFQDFYTTISSEEARDLVEEVRQIEEVQRLNKRLTDLGVAVDETLAIVYEFLSWGEPNKY